MTIIVGVDGSQASEQALHWAVREARLRRAAVRAVYAWEYPSGLVAPDPLLGGPVVGSVALDADELQRLAEGRLAAAVEAVDESGEVEQLAVPGHAAEVLVEQAGGADLLVVGSRGHGGLAGALLGSVSHACAHHAVCPVVIVRGARATGGRETPAWSPDEVVAREVERNRQTWEALERLGLTEGTALRLEFVYESGGAAGDRELADFLRRETDYEVEVETGGVTGSTQPIPVDPKALDEWVRWMVIAGHDHGGCAFDGWTATVSAGD